MSEPLLSIVIANYNYGRFLGEAIRSVLDQHCPDVELIVIDGGSTDNSVEIIKKYQDKISWWCSEPDGGQSAAFNKGFSHAHGKYLTWLNADDILVPGSLAAIVRELEAHPDCEWFTGNFVRFLESTHEIVQVGWGPHCYPKWMQRRNSPLVIFGPSTVFGKGLWERSGRIAEDLHFMMDNEMWMRFVVAGVKQRRIRHFIWAFRMHEESKTAEFGEHKMDPEKLKVFNAEAEKTYARTGYSSSRFWRIVQLAGRVVDGSLLVRHYYCRHLRRLSCLGVDRPVKLLSHRSTTYLKFQSWFCEALARCGVAEVADLKIPHKVRALLGRLFGFRVFNPVDRLLVCGCHRIESCAWPWCYRYEIVPVMWDLWPGNYEAFRRFVRRNKVKTVFCTASQSVDWINENCAGVSAHWLPEAIAASEFPCGGSLHARSIDILTYGRKFDPLYGQIEEWARQSHRAYRHGAGHTLDQLKAVLQDAKISICYPLCDTNPSKAQGVETMTQRYWEAMLSGTLIVGRAPKELVEVCGYDPVIPAGSHPLQTIGEVLEDIRSYQDLADRNRRTAEAKGDWSQRMENVMAILNNK